MYGATILRSLDNRSKLDHLFHPSYSVQSYFIITKVKITSMCFSLVKAKPRYNKTRQKSIEY